MNMIAKKLLVLLLGFFTLSGIYAQTFSTAKTLKPRTFSVGIQPTIIASGSTDFILFGHFGYGLKKGLDLGAKVGVLNGSEYIGIDIEKVIGNHFSFSAGAHQWGNFGLDATLLASTNIAKSVELYGGVDLDIVFGNDVSFPLWIPLGAEVYIKKKMSLLIEANIAATDAAVHMFGGGLNFYF
jgi:hypothetical protein